jgi:hydroxymethylbilane synthase
MAAHAELTAATSACAVVYAPQDGWRIGIDVTAASSGCGGGGGGGVYSSNGSGNGADSADGADPISASRAIGLSLPIGCSNVGRLISFPAPESDDDD